MNQLVIRKPEQHSTQDRTTVAAHLELPGEHHEMWFRGPRDVLRAEGADAFVITCLPTAMRLGLDMRVEDSVSPKLLASLATVQDILCKWHPDFRRIEIRATSGREPSGAVREAAATFFSGGVDSFYSALAHRESISALVMVHGFDLALEKVGLRARVSRALHEAALWLGKPLLEIETNSRQITERHASWLYQQFGPALSGVAVLMGGFGRILIPSAESYAHLDVCASHPLLDPLWSTEYTTLVHDGAESDRNEKVAAISHFPAVLRGLRVCWENPDDAYNCGRCEKCIRTMLSLEAAGAMGRCTAFDAPLTPAAVGSVRLPNQLVAYHFEESLAALRTAGTRPDLTRPLERVMARARAAQIIEDLRALPGLPLGTPGIGGAILRRPGTMIPALAGHGLRGLVRRVRGALERLADVLLARTGTGR